MDNKENSKFDEALNDIIKNQTENSTYQFATIMKSFYDNLIKVGFSKDIAKEMIIAMAASSMKQGK